jgi:hypothetical protein
VTDRDETLGAALRELDVPDHRPGFEDEVRRLLETEPRPRHGMLRWRLPAAGVAVAAVAAALVVLLVGLPKSGTGPSSALAARVKAKVATRLATGVTLSGRIVYRSSEPHGPSSSRVFFAMDFLGALRVDDLRTHTTAVYDATDGVERSLNTSASLGGKTLFAAERSGVALGPPDGGPSDVFLQRQLSAFAHALLAEPDPRVRPIVYAGRDAWLADISVTPNGISRDYDRLELTIDAATGVPVHAVATLNGKLRFDMRVEGLAVDARLRSGVFAMRFEPGQDVSHENDGFRRIDLAAAATVTGYPPPVPEAVPHGYTFDVAAVAAHPTEGTETPDNPPSRNVFSISYRRGFEQFLVTARLRGSSDAHWHDPFAIEGVSFNTEHVTLHGGALDGVDAQVVVDPRSVPHLWAVAKELVVTVSGDLSRDELVDVAQSLHSLGSASSEGCTASELSLSVGLQGQTGALGGSAGFTNVGNRTCTLEGMPRIAITRTDGSRLDVHAFASPPAYPTLALKPGDAAYVHLIWQNWCGGAVGPLTLRVELPHGGGLRAPLEDTPPCVAPHHDSTIGVGWFGRD